MSVSRSRHKEKGLKPRKEKWQYIIIRFLYLMGSGTYHLKVDGDKFKMCVINVTAATQIAKG